LTKRSPRRRTAGGARGEEGAVDAVVGYVRLVAKNPNMRPPPSSPRSPTHQPGRAHAAGRGQDAGFLGHHLKDVVKGGIKERFAELRREWASARSWSPATIR